MQNITDEVLVGRGLLADIALAATVHLQSGEQVLVVLVELCFMGVRRQGVDMNLATLADPENMAVVAVFLCSEHTSQFIDSWLIVQIHHKAP
ncbi:hypothetical protein D3C78_1161720 [compost metagenome]